MCFVTGHSFAVGDMYASSLMLLAIGRGYRSFVTVVQFRCVFV